MATSSSTGFSVIISTPVGWSGWSGYHRARVAVNPTRPGALPDGHAPEHGCPPSPRRAVKTTATLRGDGRGCAVLGGAAGGVSAAAGGRQGRRSVLAPHRQGAEGADARRAERVPDELCDDHRLDHLSAARVGAAERGEPLSDAAARGGDR